MSDEAIYAKLRSFFVERYPRELGADEPLIGSGAIDSLGVLDLVAYIEREFGLRLGDEDISPENFHSLARVAAFLAERMRV
jgi:acyl carrier protein